MASLLPGHAAFLRMLPVVLCAISFSIAQLPLRVMSQQPNAPQLFTNGISLTGEQLNELIGRGRKAAHIYCQSCHLFPEPDLLDKKTWIEQTLPRMKIRVGLSPAELERQSEAALIKATGIIPEKPLLSLDEWNAIVVYYAASAPAQSLPQDPRKPIGVGLRFFKVEMPKFRHAASSTTMVRFNSKDRRIYAADAEHGALDIATPDGNYVHSIKLENVPVAMTDNGAGIFVTLIGSFLPSERRLGGLSFLERTTNGFKPPKVILKDLPRTSDTQFADLNGDGKTDFVICMFGNMSGRFSWFENLGNGEYKEHVLIDKAGAVRAVIQDFNNDGIPDIAVLMAQEIESLLIFTNDGKGKFTPQVVFQKHPLYGHTYFEPVDFNRDGRIDFLVTNGDNGEYPSPTKKYHGVRVYLNKGENQFEEAFFYPLNGAFKAVARDFDGDGDLDIAAISFFPDYEKAPEESFVFLENNGKNEFTASTFRECISGRWLTMDVDDIDGDGDLDIILGSYIHGPTEVPDFLMRDWEKGGPPFVVLRNTSR